MTDLDLAAVAQVMEEAGIGPAGPLYADRLTAGRSNLTFRLTDGTKTWLLRRPPTGGLTPSAHDVGREHRVTSALHWAGVPVATPVLLCEDASRIGAPFTLASWVAGRTIQTRADLATLSETEVATTTEALVRNLAALHEVDYVAAGLGDFARADGYAARQLKRWAGQWDLVKVEHDALARVLRDLLAERMPDTQERVGVIHGDFRIDNVIVGREDPAEVLAIVDWELSTLGDPVADVALMCSYRHPALSAVLGVDAAWASDRIPAPDELAEHYQKLSGSSLPHWEFFLALGYYKLAVIAQGIDHRFRAGATSGVGFQDAGKAVPQLLEAGLDALRS